MSHKLSSNKKQKKNLLVFVMVATFAIIGSALFIFTKASGTATFSLSPTSGSYVAGAIIPVSVQISTTNNVNTVISNLTYDSTKLDFDSIDITGNAFPDCLRNTGGNGTVAINCGIGGSTKTGSNLKVATVKFKFKTGLVANTTALVSVASSSAIYEGNAVNVWSGVMPSATYTHIIPDTTAPVTAITAPTANAVLESTVPITATATDASGISKVDFYMNGTLIGSDSTSPYSINWNSTTLVDGTYSLTSKAYDTVTPTPNIGTSPAVSVKIQNYKQNLTISNLTISPAVPRVGEPVVITATITNNGTLALPSGLSVITGFTLDSASVNSAADTTALAVGASRTVSYTWNATIGNHTVFATADKTGVVTETNESDNSSQSVIFNVYKSGDANKDAKVDGADFSILNNNWGIASPTYFQADFNHDGKVDGADFSILNNNWGL